MVEVPDRPQLQAWYDTLSWPQKQRVGLLQWDLIMANFSPGDGHALLCWCEAARRLKKQGMAHEPENEPKILEDFPDLDEIKFERS